MKLRTVINELGCTAASATRFGLMDTNVIPKGQNATMTPDSILFVRLCPLGKVTRPGEREVLLVHVGAEMPQGLELDGDAVAIAHGAPYEELEAAFSEIPARIALLELLRERMFEAFSHSYDLAQFARRSFEIIGNPIVITNSDGRLLASAGEFPAAALDVQEVLSRGYLTEEVSSDMERNRVVEGARSARHSVMTYSARYGRHWVTSLVYYHHLEMGRYDVMEKDRAISGIDLELIDYASQLAGILMERLGVTGGRVGAGSSVLLDLISDSFFNEETMRAQVLLTNLPLDATYVMATFVGRRGADRDYLTRVGALLAGSSRECLWCVAEKGVLCMLAPLTGTDPSGCGDYDRVVRRLRAHAGMRSILEDNDMRAYVSEPFDDLRQAAGRFRQCRMLSQIPHPRSRGRVVLLWENRCSALAVNADSSELAEMLLDRRVLAMADYDREHGTAYLETAMASAANPGSPQSAASALSVHRNTLSYRVNKIRELFRIDLRDGDDIMALGLTVQIMDAMR